MTRDDPFYTVTMARIHVQQGNLDQARRIYRHLLEKEPGRPDLVQALEALSSGSGTRLEDLAPLLRQWRELAQRYRSIQKIKTRHRLDEGKHV